MLIKVQVAIYKSDGKSPPDSTRIVAPVNNSALSIFSALETQINDNIVSLVRSVKLHIYLSI